MQKDAQKGFPVISGEQGLSGTYPYLSLGILAFWICIKEISSTGRFQEVLERAYRNTARQEFSLMSMEDIMREMFSAMASAPEDVEALERMIKENPFPLYILTNEERLNGANALVCPQVLQDAYETLGEPYYVLPSSTHEVLLVKESEGFSPEELRNMVSEVNISTVSPEDLLSFKIFRYDGRTLSAVKEETQTMTEAARKAKEHGFKLI